MEDTFSFQNIIYLIVFLWYNDYVYVRLFGVFLAGHKGPAFALWADRKNAGR